MSEHKHLYNRAMWKRMRAHQLSVEPLCRMCAQVKRVVPASVADHVKPHRGDEALFFDVTNLQSLCKSCHDAHKQAQEHQVDGLLRGAGHDGRPLDLAHPWHQPVKALAGPQSDSTGSGYPGLGDGAIEPQRACAAAGRGICGGGVGGQILGVGEPKTARVPSFANRQNSIGGA